MPYCDLVIVMFSHNLVKENHLVATMTENGRVYSTPEGNSYSSITTILGRQPKPGLVKWRKMVGDKEADRIMEVSSRRGNEMHDCCECYVRNEPLPEMSLAVGKLFNTQKKALKNVGEVQGIEIPLYSDRLRLAGRVDLIGDYEDVLSIIDFKNSRKEKPKHFCEDYFTQMAFYSVAFFENYGIKVRQAVVLIAEWGNPVPTIYKVDVRDYISRLRKINDEFNLRN